MPARRAASSWQLTVGGSSVSPSVPTVVNGDAMLMFAAAADTGSTHSFGTVTGWTRLQSESGPNVGPRAALYYRLANNEPASYTVTYTLASTLVAQIVTYKPSSGGTLSLDTSNIADSTSSTSCTCASMNLANAGELVAFFGAWNTSESSITVSGTFGDSSTSLNQTPGSFSCDALFGNSGATGTFSSTAATAAVNVAFLAAIIETAAAIPFPWNRWFPERKKPRRRLGRRHPLDLMQWNNSRSTIIVPALPWAAPKRKKLVKRKHRKTKRDGMAWNASGVATQPPYPWPTETRKKLAKKKSRKRVTRDASWFPASFVPPLAYPFGPRKRQSKKPRKRLGRQSRKDIVSWIPFSAAVRFPFITKRARRVGKKKPVKRRTLWTGVVWFPPPPVIPPNVYVTPRGVVRHDNSLRILGQVGAGSFVLSKASVRDIQVTEYSGPGTAIQASKLQKLYQKDYGQTGAVGADQRVLHVTRGAVGSILQFVAWAGVAPTGSDTVTVDLLSDGVSVLTSPITLSSTTAAYTLVTANIATAALTPGTILEVKITNSGTSAQRVGARVTLTEDPQ